MVIPMGKDMTVLVCSKGCSSKVVANKCCGKSMSLKGQMLHCEKCKKEVEVNECCGSHMKEMTKDSCGCSHC